MNEAKAIENRAVISILNKEKVPVEIIELEALERNEEERICKFKLNQWKQKVLNCCKSGANEASSFISTHQEFYSKEIEQSREDFYEIIKMLLKIKLSN